MLKKFMFTCGYILHRLNPLLGTKLGLFLVRSTFVPADASLWLERSGACRSDQVAAFSTALRSATEENDSGGYVTVPCPSKVKQLSSTVDWLKF